MSKHTQNKKVLEDHKKVGSRFIPPMKQIPNMNSTSYVNQMLPELIWIGLINDSIGYIRGARLIEKIFIAADEIWARDAQTNFAYASSYGMLDDDEERAFLDKLTPLNVLDDLKTYLAPLVLLYYDEFPMRFIGPPSAVISDEQLISKISTCVEKHIYKYETPGIVLNGSVLLSRLVTKKISFPAGMELPDINSVIDAPESAEAKRAAGFLRANALGEFGILGISDRWARYFWNRGYELSHCKLQAGIENDE
jgi:hypothetical protein